MGQCRCSSKKHGHGERCNRPTADNSDFCEECKQQMAILMGRSFRCMFGFQRTTRILDAKRK